MTQLITEKQLEKALELTESDQIVEAVNTLLADINVGDTVSAVEGVPYPSEGLRGKVRSVSTTNEGFVDVEMPNGAIYTLQKTLLIKV